MKSLILALLFATVCASQTVSLTLGASPQRVDQGEQVTIEFTLNGDEPITAIQFELSPAPDSWNTPLQNKQLNANGGKVVIAGLNQERIPNGIIATAVITIQQTTQLTLSGLLAANADGDAIEVTPGTLVEIAVFDYDSNGDGTVDVADLQTNINMVLELIACLDIDGNNACDVLDVQRLINRILRG